MIRGGIIGLGFMAATHIKAYREVPGVKIGAICNPSGRNLDGDFSKVSGNVGTNEPVRLDLSDVRAYRKIEEICRDPDLDFIDICAPTPAHRSLAIEALRAGKHVICEKPLARTSAAAAEMLRESSQAGKYLMPAMCMRFWPGWTWLKTAIASETYGPVLSARFRRVAEPPAWGRAVFFNGELSGGALLDLHIHDVDFIRFCFGEPRSLFSQGHTRFSGAIDHVVTQYRFGSGPVVYAEGGWAMTEGFGFSMSYTVNFQNATADYDLARGADALRLFQAGQAPTTIHTEKGDGYVGELKYFSECVRERRPPALVTADDGLAALKICEAEVKSAASGKIVELSQVG